MSQQGPYINLSTPTVIKHVISILYLIPNPSLKPYEYLLLFIYRLIINISHFP